NNGSEATLYWKTDASMAVPDIFQCQLEFPVPSAETAALGIPAHGWTMFAGLAHPKSRGALRLSGPGVLHPVLIDSNTPSDPDDLRTAIESVQLARALGNSAAFDGLVRGESLPGRLTRREMENYVRNAAGTYWHQACTARMGRDAMAVVDSQLRVYGVERL